MIKAIIFNPSESLKAPFFLFVFLNLPNIWLLLGDVYPEGLNTGSLGEEPN